MRDIRHYLSPEFGQALDKERSGSDTINIEISEHSDGLTGEQSAVDP
jgi:hypothetical protein